MDKNREPIRRDTLTRQAYRILRTAILNRRYPPGSKLVVRELAEALGLSPTPVKEALAALAQEGLIQAIPHRGYQIPSPEPKAVRELYELREVLEGLAARLSALKGADTKRLEALLGAQEKAALDSDLEAYGDLDLEFHRLLWRASGNQRLERMAESLDGQIRLLISTSAAVPGRLPLALAEHRAVLEHVKRRDPEGAERAMRDHVRNAWKALEACLKPPEGKPSSPRAGEP